MMVFLFDKGGGHDAFLGFTCQICVGSCPASSQCIFMERSRVLLHIFVTEEVTPEVEGDMWGLFPSTCWTCVWTPRENMRMLTAGSLLTGYNQVSHPDIWLDSWWEESHVSEYTYHIVRHAKVTHHCSSVHIKSLVAGDHCICPSPRSPKKLSPRLLLFGNWL